MASPLNYEGGLTLATNVSNLERSLAWYQEVLGFKMLYKVDEIGWGEVATEVPGGRVSIGLSQVEKVKNGATPTFQVKDLDKTRAMLEAKKVRFDGPTVEYPGMVKLATFFDPDGNPLMLSQPLGEA